MRISHYPPAVCESGISEPGIAKTTLSHIEQELWKSNIEAVRLDAFSENPFALSLYQKAGYEKVGVADWRKGRFYLMEKRL